jgi:hypothetical protein
MRTFPHYLGTFRRIVNERGEQLRRLTFDELKQYASDGTEAITVDSHPATISIIVQLRANDSLRVVVQGFVKARFLLGKHVALDGFYKNRDGTVSPMPENELYEFD